MNILASIMLITGICLILKNMLDLVPKIKKWREEKNFK